MRIALILLFSMMGVASDGYRRPAKESGPIQSVPDSDRAAIMKLAADVKRMYETADSTLAPSIYSPDCAGGPIVNGLIANPWGQDVTVGHSSIAQMMTWYARGENIYVYRPYEFRMDFEDTRVIVRGDTGALAAVLTVSYLETPGGERRTIRGRYTLVLRKMHGAWKVWEEHYSNPANALPPPLPMN